MFGKNRTYDNVQSHRKEGLYLFPRKYILENTIGLNLFILRFRFKFHPVFHEFPCNMNFRNWSALDNDSSMFERTHFSDSITYAIDMLLRLIHFQQYSLVELLKLQGQKTWEYRIFFSKNKLYAVLKITSLINRKSRPYILFFCIFKASK